MTFTFRLEQADGQPGRPADDRSALPSKQPLRDSWARRTSKRPRRIYAGDWREVEERNALVLRQLARAAGDRRRHVDDLDPGASQPGVCSDMASSLTSAEPMSRNENVTAIFARWLRISPSAGHSGWR
jgi:hypothetical protein